jgi:hypothetical protein
MLVAWSGPGPSGEDETMTSGESIGRSAGAAASAPFLAAASTFTSSLQLPAIEHF